MMLIIDLGYGNNCLGIALVTKIYKIGFLYNPKHNGLLLNWAIDGFGS